MNKLLLVSFTYLLLISCSNPEENTDTGAWFGGEIINPTTNHVVLTKNNVHLDTIPLDENNRFLYRLDSVDKGIYNFIHNEYQIMYIEPGDSLLVRLNTIEFDESLTFTGKGAKRNNFLMQMFLHNEEENQRMPAYYKLDPENFIQKMDSMKEARYENLDAFISRNKPCKAFHKIAQANIKYDYLLKREFYPFAHFGRNNLDKISTLPKDYYSFREEINYNKSHLQSYYTYFRFLINHFDYLAFEKYKEEQDYDSESYLHNLHKLKEIDRLVSLDTLKNNLLRTTIRRFILNTKSQEEEKKLLELYTSLSTDEEHLQEINKLSEASLTLMPGNAFPNINLIGFNNKSQSLKQLIDKPTVVYFWSLNSVNHYKNAHAKAMELQQKYPEYDFIAISTDDNHESWKRIVLRNGFDITKEYRFQNPSEAIEVLIINSINKAIVVDGEGKILDNNAGMFRSSFEEELLGYINQ